MPSVRNAATPAWLTRVLAGPQGRDTVILGPVPSTDTQEWTLARRIEDSQGATVAVVAGSLPAPAFKAMVTPEI